MLTASVIFQGISVCCLKLSTKKGKEEMNEMINTAKFSLHKSLHSAYLRKSIYQKGQKLFCHVILYASSIPLFLSLEFLIH